MGHREEGRSCKRCSYAWFAVRVRKPPRSPSSGGASGYALGGHHGAAAASGTKAAAKYARAWEEYRRWSTCPSCGSTKVKSSDAKGFIPTAALPGLANEPETATTGGERSQPPVATAAPSGAEAPESAPPPGASATQIAGHVADLGRMHEQGQLDDEEFGLLKSHLLSDYERQVDAERSAAEAVEVAQRQAAVVGAAAERSLRATRQRAEERTAERARQLKEFHRLVRAKGPRGKDAAKLVKDVVRTAAQVPPAKGSGQITEGWVADPTERNDLRYWDGATWTSWVANGGETSEDPMEADSPNPLSTANEDPTSSDFPPPGTNLESRD